MNHHPSQIVFLADSSPLFDRPRDTERHSSRIPSAAWLKKGRLWIIHAVLLRLIDEHTHTHTHTLDIPRPRFSAACTGCVSLSSPFPTLLHDHTSQIYERPDHNFPRFCGMTSIVWEQALVPANHDFRSEILKGVPREKDRRVTFFIYLFFFHSLIFAR